ncbi:MAG: hypothetical protein ACOCXG_02430 [Nanoarchaeota archaeon]
MESEIYKESYFQEYILLQSDSEQNYSDLQKLLDENNIYLGITWTKNPEKTLERFLTQLQRVKSVIVDIDSSFQNPQDVIVNTPIYNLMRRISGLKQSQTQYQRIPVLIGTTQLPMAIKMRYISKAENGLFDGTIELPFKRETIRQYLDVLRTKYSSSSDRLKVAN